MSCKVMFSLPNQLALRMKTAIPARERSRVVAHLLEKEINAREQKLYLCAKELEESYEIKKDMSVWDEQFGQDGLEDV